MKIKRIKRTFKEVLENRRVKRVFKEILESKKDNLIKLRVDLHYRLTKEIQWGEQKKELLTEKDKMGRELGALKITSGQSTKSRERTVELERNMQKIEARLNETNRALAEIPAIIKSLSVGQEFTTMIENMANNLQEFKKTTDKHVRKSKDK